MLWTFDPNIPEDMRAIKTKNNWYYWKAITSTVTASELHEIEELINLEYPTIYKEFLSYKHFYRLEKIQGIMFFSHVSKNWKIDLLDIYKSRTPEKIIKKGFIPFGFIDGGALACFDTNANYKIVSIFYDENSGIEPKIETLFSSFKSILNIYC